MWYVHFHACPQCLHISVDIEAIIGDKVTLHEIFIISAARSGQV